MATDPTSGPATEPAEAPAAGDSAGVSIPIDADGRIASDLLCLNCGYNLRSIPVGEACPECGIAVRTTLRRDRLGDAPAPWRRTLRRGGALLFVGTLLCLVTGYLGLAVAMAGLWLLTKAEPGRAEPLAETRYRWAARLLAGAGAATLLTITVATLVLIIREGHVGASHALSRAAGSAWEYVDGALIAGHALFIMGFLCATLYVDGLAQRVPDDGLRRASAWARRAWIGATLAMVAIGLVANYTNRLTLAQRIGYEWATGLFFGAVALVLLVLWIFTLRLAWRLWRRLPA